MSSVLIDSQTEHCSDALDLFTLPAHQVAVDSFYNTDLLPSHPLSNANSQIVFEGPVSDDYSDLDQTRLCIKVRIKNGNRTDLGAFVANTAANPAQANSVGFANLALNTMFAGVEVKLNGISTNSNFFTNGYISYFQTILSYGEETLNSKLSLAGWAKDNDLTLCAADAGSDVTSGFYKRAKKTELSKEWTLIGHIHNPLMMQNRYLIPLMPLTIVLTKARPEFCLQSNSTTPDFTFEISEAKVMIRRVKVISTYKLKLENELSKHDCIYPLRTFDCRPYSLDAGIKSFTFSNIFPGNNTIPDYCCVGLLRASVFSGSWGSSPYIFENFGLEEISIGFDQHRFTYECQYENIRAIDYTASYDGLFIGAGSKSNNGLSISLEQFANGWALYTFYFNREESLNCNLWNTKIAGSARLSLRFSAATNNPALTVLVYSEENQILKVSSKREVIRTYNI